MTETIIRTLARLNDDTVTFLSTITARLAENPANLRPVPFRQPPLRLAHETPGDRPTILPAQHFFASIGGNCLKASDQLAAWLETTPDALLGEKGWDFIDGADERKRIAGLWMLIGQNKAPQNYTVRCKTALGRIVYAFVRVLPCEKDGKVTCIGTVHPQVLPARVRFPNEQAVAWLMAIASCALI